MESYVLGLDLGSASIGWALVEPNKKVIDCGVRIFDPGVDLETFQKGKEGSSNNVARREARLHRRQLRRRAGRQRELFALLQTAGLLPNTARSNSEGRNSILTALDADLRKQWEKKLEAAKLPQQWLVYLLRRNALDTKLEAFELGRVLYQLAQRRGYKSNRKESPVAESEPAGKKKKSEASAKKDDDRKVVLREIVQLEHDLAAAGARTLGEYLCGLDPAAQRKRPHIIRQRFAPRKLYEREFSLIWQAQAVHHAALTPELREQVYRLLFYQRPITPGKPGTCELEPEEKRAPKASLAAQRFRVLQKVNDLRVMDTTDGTPLSVEQRRSVVEALEGSSQLTFEQIRKLLGLPSNTGFNLQRGDEKRLVGNRTHKAMHAALGSAWDNLNFQTREELVEEWLAPQEDEVLLANLRQRFGFTVEQAQAVLHVHLEEGYCPFSKQALLKLLRLMEQGQPFKTAEAEVYGTSFAGGTPLASLPPVENVIPFLPNPAVKRALTELRKVVNAIVAVHGKPAEVRIELAREIKKTAKERFQEVKRMREGEKRNMNAARRLLSELGMHQPRGFDLLKVRLFEECKGVCVYCDKSLGGVHNLFDGSLEVDHILPRNRFPDDSFSNRVLVHRACNQQKLGRTPLQAFGGDSELWEQITERVKKLGSAEKLRRFEHGSETDLDLGNEDSFSSRRLNDTRYTSKLAARYLGLLYGGRDVELPDGTRRRVVFATSGLATATLRKEWKLESILREPLAAESEVPSRRKPRTDHRHHAVDAITISLTSNAAIQQLGQALAVGVAAGAERLSAAKLQQPWPDFVDSIRPLVEEMHVSHRPNHHLRGQLHDETNYSAAKKLVVPGKGRQKSKEKNVVHVRKPVHLLTEKQIREAIVDLRVRGAVTDKLEALGGDPKRLEQDPAMLKTRNGASVPIFRTRIRMPGSPLKVGRGARERYVASAGNHHIPIFEVRKKGKLRWESPGVVSRHEAHARLTAGQKIVEKEWTEEAEFLFYLMGGDMVRMDHPAHPAGSLFVVRTISEDSGGNFEIDFVRDTDARLIGDIKKDDKERGREGWLRARNVDSLRDWHCRKVFVDVLGKLHG